MSLGSGISYFCETSEQTFAMLRKCVASLSALLRHDSWVECTSSTENAC